MIPSRKIGRVPGSAVIALLCAGLAGAQQARPDAVPTTPGGPNAFGTDAYTVTTVSATSFFPDSHFDAYNTSGSLGRFGAANTITNFTTSVDLPAGAVIDFIGLNSSTDTPGAIGAELIRRSIFGVTTVIGAVESTVHAGSWNTDFNANPIGYVRVSVAGQALILRVQTGSHPTNQFFGWVEIWWKRTVSPAPGSANFNDVPTNHPFFQFISALSASGITGGCGNGNFCPDNPVTRGQMAVFLAKALGLHWTN